MFLTYVTMHDYVLFYNYDLSLLPWSESIWEELSNINISTPTSLLYFLLGTLPGYLLQWAYEVGHTFFVVTGQLVAYFAMIFWLFLYLFTFFVIEKQEDYFKEKRKFRQDFFQKTGYLNKK